MQPAHWVHVILRDHPACRCVLRPAVLCQWDAGGAQGAGLNMACDLACDPAGCGMSLVLRLNSGISAIFDAALSLTFFCCLARYLDHGPRKSVLPRKGTGASSAERAARFMERDRRGGCGRLFARRGHGAGADGMRVP